MKRKKTLGEAVEYELHKWKRQLFIIDKAIMVLVVLAFAVVRADYVTLAAYLYSLVHLFITQRIGLLQHYLLSSGMALLFVFLIRDQYGYNHEFITLFGLNLFSLTGWAAGLFAVYLIYAHLEHWIPRPTFWKRFLVFLALYWPLLIIAEWVGYYIFDIHNVATAMYDGLPFCDCMHAPWWMQLGYIAMGPVYFVLSNLFGLENPHRITTKK